MPAIAVHGPSLVAAQRYEGEDMKVGYVNQTIIGAAIMHLCPKNFSSTFEDIDTRFGLKSMNRAAAGKFTVSRPRE